jgi:DNA-binding response OmpR family regulator
MKTPGSRRDVLLVEDDHDDMEIFESALKATTIPYELRYARNGDELFEKLDQAIPSLLFLDINMPCRDGIACILEIRKNRKYDGLPVIMLTSLLHKHYVDNTYRYGANYYVVKPTSIAALTEKLKHILSIEWGKQLYYPSKNEFVLA